MNTFSTFGGTVLGSVSQKVSPPRLERRQSKCNFYSGKLFNKCI